MGSITVQQSRLMTTGPGDWQYHNPAVQTHDHRTGLWAVSQSSSPDSGPQDPVVGSITVQQSRLMTTGPGDWQYHSPAVQTQDHKTGLWAVSQSSSPDSGPQDRVVGSITIQQSRLRTTGPGCGQYHSPAVQTLDHRAGLWAVSQSSSPDSRPHSWVVGSITVQQSRLKTT